MVIQSGNMALSKPPTMTSSRGSHSLCELTGQADWVLEKRDIFFSKNKKRQFGSLESMTVFFNQFNFKVYNCEQIILTQPTENHV
jgi:hypothetical protein